MDKNKKISFNKGDKCLILAGAYSLEQRRIKSLSKCSSRESITFDNLHTYFIGKGNVTQIENFGVYLGDIHTYIMKCGTKSKLFLKRKLCEMYAQTNLKTTMYDERFKTAISELKKL